LRVNNYFNINFSEVITFPIKNFKRFEFPSLPSLSVRLIKETIYSEFIRFYLFNLKLFESSYPRGRN